MQAGARMSVEKKELVCGLVSPALPAGVVVRADDTMTGCIVTAHRSAQQSKSQQSKTTTRARLLERAPEKPLVTGIARPQCGQRALRIVGYDVCVLRDSGRETSRARSAGAAHDAPARWWPPSTPLVAAEHTVLLPLPAAATALDHIPSQASPSPPSAISTTFPAPVGATR